MSELAQHGLVTGGVFRQEAGENTSRETPRQVEHATARQGLQRDGPAPVVVGGATPEAKTADTTASHRHAKPA